MSATHRKTTSSERAADWEMTGLSWLAVDGGVPVVRVLGTAGVTLELEQLVPVPPSPAAAEELGRRLATTHRSGADGFGAPPQGWDGDGLFGPADDLREMPLRPDESWGRFYAEQRIGTALAQGQARGRGLWDEQEVTIFRAVQQRLHDGEFDGAAESPARLHGDLWSGNVVWTAQGAVLIDPAAHGGHRETDLAFLALFGAPHLDRVVAAYDEVSPLAEGWRDRVALHQLYPVLMHAVLFGGGYVGQSVQLARRYA